MRAMASNKSENNEEENEPGAEGQVVGTQSNIQGGRQRFKEIIR